VSHVLASRRPRGLPRLAISFRFAFAGLADAWRTQPNLRIHTAFVVLITALGLYLGLDVLQWAVLVLTYSAVVAAELLNSALETLTDLACPGFHPLAKRAKDMGAAAVLVVAAAAVVVGLLILGPPLWERLATLF
jgi:diacylglycerol kinase